MRAMVRDRYGSPDVLKLTHVATPVPGPQEVLVRVLATSINDWDWGLLTGTSVVDRLLNGLISPKIRILGGDIAGRVEAVGERVEAFRVGDEVYGDLCMSGFGAFAEYVRAPDRCLVRKPASMTFEQAASIPQAGALAMQGLIDAGRLQAGHTVLVNGAGGGVGTFALQLARLYGVDVTAVDKPGKLAALRAMGAAHTMDGLREDFTRLGQRYDLILDVRTNRSPRAYARALKRHGTYATVGGDLPRLLQVLLEGPFIRFASRKHVRVVALKPNKDLARMNEWFESGRLRPVIDSVYPFDALRDALRRFGTGDHIGKIIVTMT